MATTYCSVEDVADLLRIPITATTIPNKAQVEKIINRKEDEFEEARQVKSAAYEKIIKNTSSPKTHKSWL